MEIRKDKPYIDIRLTGPHKLALQRLKERNGEKNPVALVRILIRDAAREAGIWSEIVADAQEVATETEIA